MPEAADTLTTPTRRLILSAFTGAAFAGTAVVVAAPPLAQAAAPVCRDMYEALLLAAFRRLSPHEKEAALTMAQSLADRLPLPVAASPLNPDAELMAACKRFAQLEKEYGRLCQLTDWPVEHKLTPAEQALQNEFNAVSDEQEKLGAWLAEAVPQTAAGLQAKAQAVMAYGFGPAHDMIGRLTLSLVQDVAGERGV